MAPKKGGFYAVRVGRTPGVYTTWPEAEAQVKGFVGALHKKFPTRLEAESFVRPTFSSGQHTPASAGGSRGTTRTREDDGAAPAGKKARTSSSGDKVFMKEGRKVYCDGSSRGNGKADAVAGIGVFWSHEPGAPNLSERLPGKLQTNNRAEMYAVARILETDPTPELPLTICTDSQYTISVFSEWIPSWRKRGWKTSGGSPVLNKDLIQYVLSLISLRMPPNSTSPTANVSFKKVKAHVGIEGNEMADKLANTGAMSPEVEPRNFDADTKANEKKLREKGLQKVEVEFEVDLGDLWTDEELKEMGQSQQFS